MISLTMDGVQPRERVEYWEDLVTRHVTPMRMEPSGNAPLMGEVRAESIGNITVAQVSGQGIRALHSGAEVARTGRHLYAACVNLGGTARIRRRGEAIELQHGDVFITDSRREFSFDLERPWRHLVLSMPVDWIDSRLPSWENIGGMVVRDHPLVRLWAGYLATGYSMANDFTPSAATLFARNAVELLAQALQELRHEHPTPSNAWRAAIFQRACQIIAIRFGESSLSPDAIALDMGISTRTLARIFAAQKQTVMRRVFDERVHQAKTLLASPRSAQQSITRIAFACGFNDSSHFGRVFLQRTGMTPSEWRKEASFIAYRAGSNSSIGFPSGSSS